MQDNRFMNTATATAVGTDVGLRAYMLGVYNHMTTALLLTGFFAFATKMGCAKCGRPRSVDVRYPSEMAYHAGTAWHGVLAISADQPHVCN